MKRLAWVLLWAFWASACGDSKVEANFTAVELELRFPAAWQLRFARLTGKLKEGSPAFDEKTKSLPAASGEANERVPVLFVLDPELSGKTINFEIFGLDAQNQLVARGEKTLGLALGRSATATIALVKTSSTN